MKTIVTSLIIAVLLNTSLAFAGELDDYYLEQFGETTPSATLLKTTATTQARRCGMPLRRGLKRDWSSLESDTQKVLAKYLAKPALSGEGIVGSNGGHFYIHYATSGADAPPLADTDNNLIPDWVETVANAFETVYAHEVSQMGYRQPPNIPYDVYLQQLADRSEFGFTQSDVLTGKSATSYIVIDNDFAESIYHPYNGSTGLQITAAHEFHHAIQYGYNYYFDIWYAEATATWIEDEVYDTINQLYVYLPPYYRQTSLQLDTATSITTGGGYGRWSFNRYLSEAAYPTTIVRSIWENLATKSPINGADIPMLPVIDEVLVTNGSSLPASFLGFSKRFLLNNWASHQNEIALFPALTFDSGSTYPVATTFTVPAVNLPGYSFKYLKLLPTADMPTQLTISYPSKPTVYEAIAFLQSTGATSQFPADNNGNITIPSVSKTDTVYLLICNNQPSAVISDGGGGGGGGGGCFIATAAYGSYLHPKVMVLRNFRDNYLLTNEPGKLLVSLYYKFSPPIADMVRGSDTARFLVRGMLAPLVFVAEHCVLVLWVCGAVFLSGGLHINRRRTRRKITRCITT